MKLENEFLLVEIAAQGAEVTRIFNKKDETDVLWEGNPVFWCRHSPLLFPYVGKTYQNKLWIDGKQYDTEKHGFARTSLFDCVAESENSVTYMLKDSEETKKMFPYAFELYVTYTLEENRLHRGTSGDPFCETGREEDRLCPEIPGKEDAGVHRGDRI